jgi:hypothetical protein
VSLGVGRYKTCLQRCNVLDPPTVWDDLIEEGCSHWKTKSILGVTCRLVLSATVTVSGGLEMKSGLVANLELRNRS